MNLSFFSITKDQTNIIKSVAMIIIVLHNYLHWTFKFGENELTLNPNRFFELLAIINTNYLAFFSGLISYFGFYPLELFIFLSGYGLTKQFMKKGDTPYFKYLLPKLIKLYSLLLCGIIIYYCFFFYKIDIRTFVPQMVSVLLMYKNFSYDSIFSFMGPWWYFSLTFQLYILYPLFYKLLSKYKEKGALIIIVLSYGLIFALMPVTEAFNFPMFGNFLGHLPEFILGISLAMFKNIKLDWKILFVACIIFILSNFYPVFFPFSFLSATILMLAVVHPIINIKNVAIQKILIYIGSISMFMFITNGIIRSYTILLTIDKSYITQSLFGILHLIIVIAYSAFIAFIYKKTFAPIDRFFISKITK